MTPIAQISKNASQKNHGNCTLNALLVAFLPAHLPADLLKLTGLWLRVLGL